MISSEDIEIKLTDSVKLPASMKVHSLFLQQEETFVLDSTDTTIRRIHADGKATPIVNVMDLSDNDGTSYNYGRYHDQSEPYAHVRERRIINSFRESRNLNGSRGGSHQSGMTYHNYGRDHVRAQLHTYVCEQQIIHFYKSSYKYGMSFYDTTSGTQVFKADNAHNSEGIPKAAIVGSQVVVGSTTRLQVYNKRGVEVKAVAVESPEFRCEGQVTYSEIKDLCGYDQYSVLLLQDEGVWRADLQTGHSKLVPRITPTAHSVVCNKQYIFVGATPQFDQRENTILVFDRGSGK